MSNLHDFAYAETIATVYYQADLEAPGEPLGVYAVGLKMHLQVEHTAAILGMAVEEFLNHSLPYEPIAGPHGACIDAEALHSVCVRLDEKGPAPAFTEWVNGQLSDFLFASETVEQKADAKFEALMSPVNARLDDMCDSLERIIAVLPAHVEPPRRRSQYINVDIHRNTHAS